MILGWGRRKWREKKFRRPFCRTKQISKGLPEEKINFMRHSPGKKMQLDVDIEPTFRFTYMRYYTDKQKDTIV